MSISARRCKRDPFRNVGYDRFGASQNGPRTTTYGAVTVRPVISLEADGTYAGEGA